MNPLVRYEFADGVATLSMDDGKANVMSVAMLAELNDALDRAEKEAKVVVVRGRGGVFSGGFDLAAFKRGGPEVLTMLEAGMRLCICLQGYPLPVVAACTGHAIAMGAFLLLSTDLRIGVDVGARFQISEVRIGMTVPHMALEVCRQRLAPAQLHTATTLGLPFAPSTALAAGFLDEIVPAYALNETVRRHCADLLTLDTASFAATKRRLNEQAIEAMNMAIRADLAEWQSSGIGSAPA